MSKESTAAVHVSEAPKKERKPRTPKAGVKRVMVTLKDEHYEQLAKYAAEEEREIGAQLSLIIRRHFASLFGVGHTAE